MCRPEIRIKIGRGAKKQGFVAIVTVGCGGKKNKVFLAGCGRCELSGMRRLAEAHSRPDAVFYRHFRSAGGTSVISRAPRWKVT